MLDAAIRLTLLDVLAAAAEEITTDLAPGSVQLRLRSREPQFVVTPALAATDLSDGEDDSSAPSRPATGLAPLEGDEGAMSRINLRMPDRLKAWIEQAAGAEGLSVNAWLVRAAAAGMERTSTDRRFWNVARNKSFWVRQSLSHASGALGHRRVDDYTRG